AGLPARQHRLRHGPPRTARRPARRDEEVSGGIAARAPLLVAVIACNKREAFVQGSKATKQSILSCCCAMDCFASLAMTVVGSPASAHATIANCGTLATTVWLRPLALAA